RFFHEGAGKILLHPCEREIMDEGFETGEGARFRAAEPARRLDARRDHRLQGLEELVERSVEKGRSGPNPKDLLPASGRPGQLPIELVGGRSPETLLDLVRAHAEKCRPSVLIGKKSADPLVETPRGVEGLLVDLLENLLALRLGQEAA